MPPLPPPSPRVGEPCFVLAQTPSGELNRGTGRGAEGTAAGAWGRLRKQGLLEASRLSATWQGATRVPRHRLPTAQRRTPQLHHTWVSPQPGPGPGDPRGQAWTHQGGFAAAPTGRSLRLNRDAGTVGLWRHLVGKVVPARGQAWWAALKPVGPELGAGAEAVRAGVTLTRSLLCLPLGTCPSSAPQVDGFGARAPPRQATLNLATLWP